MAAEEVPERRRPSLVDLARVDPDRVMARLDKARAERSLAGFTKLMWPVLEPGADRALVWTWSMDAICEHLEAVSNGEILRLLINVPPGFSKSLLTNVFHPAWEWGPRDRPDLRYCSFSYSKELTIRDNRRCRTLLQSDEYRALWGDRFHLVSDQNAKVRYDTNHAGFRWASSVGAGGTGERGDRLVVDDPNNVKDAESDAVREEALFWFSEVLPSRTTNLATTSIVVIQQRTHQSDVSGHVLKSELGYEYLCLPMEFEPKSRSYTPVRRPGVERERVKQVKIEDDPNPRWVPEDWTPESEIDPEALKPEPLPVVEKMGPVRELTSQDRRTEEGELLAPDRFSREAIDLHLIPPLMSWGGEYAVAGQLQQRPAPRSGGMFRRADFQVIEATDVPAGIRWARGWDLAASDASSSAYSAAVLVGVHHPSGRTFIRDVDRFRGLPMAAEKRFVALAEQDGKSVAIDFPQDPGQAGKWQRGHLAGKLKGYDVFSSPESGTKEDRARGLASENRNGNLYLVRGSWNTAFIAEASLFPGGDYKDQVDGASRGYGRACKLKPAPATGAPKIIGG